MRDAILRYCLLSALVLLGACSQYYYDLGTPLSAAQLPMVDEQRQLGGVLAELGPPLRVSSTASGYVLAWEHWDITETKLGISLGFAGAEALSIDWGTARARGEFLLLGFNHDHEMTSATFTEWDNDAGGGKSLQPLGGLIPVVDVDDLLTAMPQHRWGAASLEELPVSLNSDNRPDTGQNGIEQRGTPTAVGQRSLEMD
ncbi:MAG: hypothetical protein V7754_21875 [Halioglobus sp.]